MAEPRQLHPNEDKLLVRFGEDLMDLIYSDKYSLNTAQIVGMLEAAKMELFVAELSSLVSE